LSLLNMSGGVRRGEIAKRLRRVDASEAAASVPVPGKVLLAAGRLIEAAVAAAAEVPLGPLPVPKEKAKAMKRPAAASAAAADEDYGDMDEHMRDLVLTLPEQCRPRGKQKFQKSWGVFTASGSVIEVNTGKRQFGILKNKPGQCIL
jgi:hypothetical protein